MKRIILICLFFVLPAAPTMLSGQCSEMFMGPEFLRSQEILYTVGLGTIKTVKGQNINAWKMAPWPLV